MLPQALQVDASERRGQTWVRQDASIEVLDNGSHRQRPANPGIKRIRFSDVHGTYSGSTLAKRTQPDHLG